MANAADKTGDHSSAILILRTVFGAGNDVYSMIWLAQIYETGIGTEKDLRKSTALMKRGAELNDAAGYSSLARYHYGVALYEGVGTDVNQAAAEQFLRRAARKVLQKLVTIYVKRGATVSFRISYERKSTI